MGARGQGRQHPIGPFVADFCCVENKLIIELDGGQHVENADADDERTSYLAGQGYRVLRFWDHEVLKDINAVTEVILQGLQSPHSNPAP